MLNQIKATIEKKLAEMNAAVEVTFGENFFSIFTENETAFHAAKNILALANQKMTGEEHDIECGHFGYFSL